MEPSQDFTKHSPFTPQRCRLMPEMVDNFFYLCAAERRSSEQYAVWLRLVSDNRPLPQPAGRPWPALDHDSRSRLH